MIADILDFWFGRTDSAIYGKSRREWFIKNTDFDYACRSSFLTLYQQAALGEVDSWKESPLGCLALIILLDQFPRNMFRDLPQAFATDGQALAYAKYAVKREYDRQLLPVQRWFVYLPFEHSESLEDQYRCIKLMSVLKDDPETIAAKTLEYSYRHLEVIQRFGRFPHRNNILGRPNTPEETEFLKQPGSSF